MSPKINSMSKSDPSYDMVVGQRHHPLFNLVSKVNRLQSTHTALKLTVSMKN